MFNLKLNQKLELDSKNVTIDGEAIFETYDIWFVDHK